MISRRRRLAFWCMLVLLVVAFAYVARSVAGSARLYRHAKQVRRGWSGSVHRADRELGFAPIPGARGAHVFAVGPEIPMQYDELGFRVPLNDDRGVRRRPYVLALGGSFTYGDACHAEETFPYKLAQELGGSEMNAGVCGYGLAQMHILGNRLIPEYKPDYVVAQYSPWLVDRAVNHFAPTYFSCYPAPYFADDNARTVVELENPVFAGYGVDLARFRDTPVSASDFALFFLRIGFPLSIRDNSKIWCYKVRLQLGLIPHPTTRRAEVLRYVYGNLKTTCAANGASLIVVVLGRSPQPVVVPTALRELNLEIVDAHSELLARLGERSASAYNEAYAHYRGEPPTLVDIHPNSHAHTEIAAAIARHIQRRLGAG